MDQAGDKDVSWVRFSGHVSLGDMGPMVTTSPSPRLLHVLHAVHALAWESMEGTLWASMSITGFDI